MSRSEELFDAAWPWIMMGMALLLLFLVLSAVSLMASKSMECPPGSTISFRVQAMVQGRIVTTIMLPECTPGDTATPVDTREGEWYHA